MDNKNFGKKNAKDERGYTYEDFVAENKLSETNEYFEDFDGWSDEKYWIVNQDALMFGFYLYESIMKQLKETEKELKETFDEMLAKNIADKHDS